MYVEEKIDILLADPSSGYPEAGVGDRNGLVLYSSTVSSAATAVSNDYLITRELAQRHKL